MKRAVFVFTLAVMMSVPFAADSETLPRVPGRPVNTSPEFLKAQQLEAQKMYKEAKEIYMRLYESQGTDILFWKLVLLLERTKDFEEMERLTLQRLNKYRGEISTMRYLAHAYYGQGDKEKGRRTLLNIIGKQWDAAGRVNLVASELISQNDLDTALEVYTTARKKTGKNELFANEVARIYAIRMKYIDALEEYLKFIDRMKIAYTNVEQMMQKALEAGKKTDDIARPIAEYLDSHPESINAARLLSGLMYDAGDFDRAYTVLITTAAATNNPRDVQNLAERFKKDGHLEKALMVYSGFYRYFENDPGRVSSLLESASIKSVLGDTEGAILDYRNITEDYQGTQEGDTASLRILQLSQDAAILDEFARSLNDFASTTKFRLVAREAYIFLGEAFLRGDRAEEAEKAFEQARIKSRSKEEMYDVCVRKALLDFFTGDYEAMSQDIVNCVGYDADGEEINDLLSLKVLSMRCSSETELRGFDTYARGRYALYRGEESAAIDSFMVAAEDTSSVVASFAAGKLAELFDSRGDADKAVTWYLHASGTADDATEYTGALIKAADILAMKPEDRERAKILYSEALTTYPGNVHESEIRRKLMKVTE